MNFQYRLAQQLSDVRESVCDVVRGLPEGITLMDILTTIAIGAAVLMAVRTCWPAKGAGKSAVMAICLTELKGLCDVWERNSILLKDGRSANEVIFAAFMSYIGQQLNDAWEAMCRLLEGITLTDILTAVATSLAALIAARASWLAKGANESAVMSIYLTELKGLYYAWGRYNALPEKGKKEKKAARAADSFAAFMTYLNALEYACAKYLRGDMNKKTFEATIGLELCRVLDENSSVGLFATSHGVSMDLFKSMTAAYQCLPGKIIGDYWKYAEELREKGENT